MTSTSQRLARNTGFNIGANLVSAALSFFLVPIVLNALGTTTYGVWTLLGSVFAFTPLLQLGISSAINRFVPLYLAKDDAVGLRRVASTSTLFFCVVALIMAGVTLALYPSFTVLFPVPIALSEQCRLSLLLVGGALTLSVTMQTAMPILSGYQRYDLIFWSRVLPIALRAVLIIGFLPRTKSLIFLALVFGITELGVNLLALLFSVLLSPRPFVSPRLASYALFREMIHYAVNTLLYSLGGVIMYKTTELLLGLRLGPEAVTTYALASSAVFLLGSAVESFCGALKPTVADLHARSGNHGVVDLAIAFQKYVLLLVLPSVAFFIIMGKHFLVLWTHRDLPYASIILSVLAMGHLFRLAQFSNFLVLVGIGEHQLFGRLTVVTGLSSAVLVFVLLVVGGGLVGAAIGTAVPMMICSGLVIPRLFNRQMNLRAAESWNRAWKPAISASAPPVTLLLVWEMMRSPATWPEMVAIVVAVACLTGISAWRLSLTPDERKVVGQVVFSKFAANCLGK